MGAALVLLKREGEYHLKPDLPGGSPEPRESAAQTLAREVLEETGLTITVNKKNSTRPHEADGRVLYMCQIELGEIAITLSEEHHGALLVPLANLPGWFADTHWHGLAKAAVRGLDADAIAA